MKFNLEVKNSKLYLNWENVNADFYKILIKTNENCEYIKVQDTFVTVSLLPVGENICSILAIKDGEIVDKSMDIFFNIVTPDAVCFLAENNQTKFLVSECKNSQGYRLYKSKLDKSFNGEQNFERNSFKIDFEKNTSYKIKPYIEENGKREILLSTDPISPIDNGFEDITIHKSYNNNLFLSWIYNGWADGFYVYQTGSDYPIYETNDGRAHFLTLKNYKLDTKFFVQAFLNTPYGKIVIATSQEYELTQRKFNKPEISLIIPAYNSENYIARSIDSALATNFEDLEIIVVNDGSKDSTQEVIDWYANNYPNVVSTQKENGGVADARNYGIKLAKGKYIAFLDNDDLVRPKMYSTLYDSITTNSTDIAIAPLYRLVDKGYTKHCTLPFEQNRTISIDEYFEIMYTPGFYNCAIWNKLYKAEIVKAHPLGILKYEDVSWTPCICSWAETFSYVDEPMYEWDRKTRPETFGDVLAKMPENDLFEHRKQAMMFFVEQGNPGRLSTLKTIAIRRLKRYAKKSSNPGYSRLIEELS